MSDEWNEDYEASGITMGPEDRLEREIAKSKALKVERLQLRDRVSRLEEKVETLGRENTELARKLAEHTSSSSKLPNDNASKGEACGTGLGNSWIQGAIGIVLIGTALLAARWYLG